MLTKAILTDAVLMILNDEYQCDCVNIDIV